MKKQTLAILVPTHTEKDLQTYLLGDISLKEIANLNRTITTSVAITGQGKFTKQILQKVIRKCSHAGLHIVGKIVPEENPARLCFLRQTGATLFPLVDYYMIMDHNMEFRSGSARRYLQAINFLNEWRNIAMIFCAGYFGGSPFGERIVPFNGRHCSTDRGILVRNNLQGQLFPEETMSLAGSADESVLAVSANLRGLWVYKQWNNPSRHYPYKGREKLEHGKTIKNNVHNWDVANENCFRWVKEKLHLAPHVDLYGRRFVNSILS